MPFRTVQSRLSSTEKQQGRSQHKASYVCVFLTWFSDAKVDGVNNKSQDHFSYKTYNPQDFHETKPLLWNQESAILVLDSSCQPTQETMQLVIQHYSVCSPTAVSELFLLMLMLVFIVKKSPEVLVEFVWLRCKQMQKHIVVFLPKKQPRRVFSLLPPVTMGTQKQPGLKIFRITTLTKCFSYQNHNVFLTQPYWSCHMQIIANFCKIENVGH